jgi:hypothetical protein
MRDVRIPRYKCIVCGKTTGSFLAFMARTCLGICTNCITDYRFTRAQVMEKFNNQRKEMTEKYPAYAKPYNVRYYEMNKWMLED